MDKEAVTALTEAPVTVVGGKVTTPTIGVVDTPAIEAAVTAAARVSAMVEPAPVTTQDGKER